MIDRGFAIVDKLEEVAQARSLTLAQTALAWLLTQPVITAPIVGANSVKQLAESLAAAGVRLERRRDGRAEPGRTRGSNRSGWHCRGSIGARSFQGFGGATVFHKQSETVKLSDEAIFRIDS